MPGELGGSLDDTDLPVYIEVGQPETQERSLADIWTALGGELKPSLDLDKHGVFTSVLIDALNGGADTEGYEADGNITVRNAGTITGGNGIAINLGNGSDVIEVTGGQINGAIVTGTGNDQFTMSSGSVSDGRRPSSRSSSFIELRLRLMVHR